MNKNIIKQYILAITAVFLASPADAALPKVKASKFDYTEAAHVQPLNQAPAQPLSLWYNSPATYWEEALPVGNGRLGAMIYGGVAKELIQLNEDSIWAGPPIPKVKENVSSTIDEVRQLLFDGKYEEAQNKQQAIMAKRISPRSYQTMGQLRFDFGPTLERANKRMNQLIDDLLELSRVERVKEENSTVDLNKTVHEVFSNYDFKMKKKGMKASIVGTLPQLTVNESRIFQVFDNLVSNAIKYCDHQEPYISISAQQDEECCTVYVKDNGSGIPVEYHEKVFTLFQRLKTDKNGTGIGLSIVQKIMKMHNGEIWIDSSTSQGCTFCLRFPLKSQN